MSERPCTAVPVGLLRPGRWCRHSAAPAFRQPSTTCSTSLPAQHLWLSGLLSRRPHSLELSPGFYPGPHHQCRLFQTFAKNVFVCSKLVHSARLRFSTITALYKSTYLLTLQQDSGQKSLILTYLTCVYSAPSLGVMLSEFCRDLWCQQTRVPRLSYDVDCIFLRLVVLVELWRTDGHTVVAYTALA